MKRGKISPKVLLFLGGVLTGFVITLALAAIGNYLYPLYPEMLLTNKPTRIFGPAKAKVLVHKHLPPGEMSPFSSSIPHKILLMTVDDKPLLRLIQDFNGQLCQFHLLNNNEQTILGMERLVSLGKWGPVYYGIGGSKSIPQKDVRVDIDFDGRFDCKLVFTNDGELRSRYIYLDNAWLEIDDLHVPKSRAKKGATEYVFSPDSGWQAVEK